MTRRALALPRRLFRFLLALCAALITLIAPTAASSADRAAAKASISSAGERNRGRDGARDRPSRDRPERRAVRDNNVVAGNTVVVNRNVDRGYGDRNYHDRDWDDDWDDDDDGFLELAGKAAAVTVGVAATTAVIGAVFDDEPDDCQPQIQDGMQYLYCDGVWYQPAMYGNDVNYVVVEAPN